MAKLEFEAPEPLIGITPVKVTLSRRNLLALLHKLDMPGSGRRIENTCTFREGVYDNTHVLVLCCEDDKEHYADPDRLSSKPGIMHPDSEEFIAHYGLSS